MKYIAIKEDRFLLVTPDMVEQDLINDSYVLYSELEYQQYVADNSVLSSEQILFNQQQSDTLRYKRRSEALPTMLAQMATENMGRVRSGLWTVPQLIALTQDPTLKELLVDLFSLSFEIAYGKVDQIDNVIITEDIKIGWKAKLASNFF